MEWSSGSWQCYGGGGRATQMKVKAPLGALINGAAAQEVGVGSWLDAKRRKERMPTERVQQAMAAAAGSQGGFRVRIERRMRMGKRTANVSPRVAIQASCPDLRIIAESRWRTKVCIHRRLDAHSDSTNTQFIPVSWHPLDEMASSSIFVLDAADCKFNRVGKNKTYMTCQIRHSLDFRSIVIRYLP